jgi:hypothetical protein
MRKSYSGASAEGRAPPPVESQFLKGKSGNPRGRPKGAISLARLTRKVAVKKHNVLVEGKAKKLSLLELVVSTLQQMAANGQPGAVSLIAKLRLIVIPSDGDEGGYMLAPAPLTSEEFSEAEKVRMANAVEPGTETNIATEEFLKAARGEPSALGQALQEFHRKYGAGSF